MFGKPNYLPQKTLGWWLNYIIINSAIQEIEDFSRTFWQSLSQVSLIYAWSLTILCGLSWYYSLESKLDIKSFIKPTNNFQYLHRQSAHGPFVNKGLIQYIRYAKNTIDPSIPNATLYDFKAHLRSYLLRKSTHISKNQYREIKQNASLKRVQSNHYVILH